MKTIHPARFQSDVFFKPRAGRLPGAKVVQARDDVDHAGRRVPYGGPMTVFGPLADKHKSHVPRDWIPTPLRYGNTAGTGIYISSSLVPMVESMLQEPLARRLFDIAKKKGLVSITEEPGLSRGIIAVDADHVRNLLSHESRIRLADAGNQYNMVSLVHELVHAATPDVSNSQTEEWFAENIGRWVYTRRTGDQRLKRYAFTSAKHTYAHLPVDSDFRQSFETLLPGIWDGWDGIDDMYRL